MKYKIGDRVKTLTEKLAGNRLIKKGMKGKVIETDSLYNKVCVEFDDDMGEHSNWGEHEGKVGHCWWVSEEDVTLVTEDKILITTDGTETLARLYEGDKVIKSAVAKCSPEDTFDFNTGAKIAFDRLMEQGKGKPEEAKSPEFKVGEQYECDFYPSNKGVLEITKIKDDRCYYKIINGMSCDKHRCHHFHKRSLFAECLKLIEKTKYYNGKVVCIEKSGDIYAYTIGKVYEFKDGIVRIDNYLQYPLDKQITTLDEWNDDPNLYCKFIPLVE